MPPFPAGRPHPACVDLPDALVAPARHGLEVLFTGLGLDPTWVDRDDLPAGGVYYGAAPDEAPPHAVRLRADAAAGVAAAHPVEPPAISRLDWNGAAWPLLYPAERTFGPPEADVLEADVVASTHAWTAGVLEAAIVARDIHGRLHDDAAPTVVVAAARPELADPTFRPPVDAYRSWLGAALERAGAPAPGRSWAGRRWAVLPTVDVDMVRTLRPSAILGNDPRRARLRKLARTLTSDGARTTFFLKAGDTSEYDVSYPLDHPALDAVWGAAGVEIGLHPSYFAHDHPPRLAAERAGLAAAAAVHGRPAPSAARTHFLRWIEPGTPRSLAAVGFAVDSSIGFSGRAGFRRGTALPFRLFDRLAGRALDMWEVPLAAMDTALWLHAAAGRAGAAEAVGRVLAGAREAGGAAVLLWHNEPLGGGHVEVLASALRDARADGAAVDAISPALAAWTAG